MLDTLDDEDRALLVLKYAEGYGYDELAELETLDNGKPIKYSKAADVPLAIDHFRYFAGWATKIEGETIPVSIPNMFTYTLRVPLGVVGQTVADRTGKGKRNSALPVQCRDQGEQPARGGKIERDFAL